MIDSERIRTADEGDDLPSHISASSADLGEAADLFLDLKSGWQIPFWIMLSLSAGIATLGLSENSAATVIGAMVVAPLGQPIIAMGAAVALGWLKETWHMLGLVLAGAILVIALAGLLGFILPDFTPNDQILGRTAPDLRDLGIAIFAGAAGAYGYRHKAYSGVLAGVAIAVALVPPLCVTGLMLEEGRMILATGGLILFTTNLVGIIIAAILVFLLSGAVREGERQKGFVIGSVLTVIVALVILVPLSINYDRVAHGPRYKRELVSRIAGELQATPGRPVLGAVVAEGAHVSITIEDWRGSPDELQALQVRLQRVTRLQVDLQTRG